MIIKKNGFTLIETFIALSISSLLAVTAIKFMVERASDDNSEVFAKDINDVLIGFDQRLSVDGYDYNLWHKKSWNTNDIKDLTQKELQAINSRCGNGLWTPQNGDTKLNLVNCNLFNKIPYDLDINASVEKDFSGYINNSIVDYSFKDKKSFDKYFKNMKKAFFYAKKERPNAQTGTIFYSLINKNTKQQVSLTKCISLKTDCAFHTVLNRQGGSESLFVDGSNSMINTNISFIDAKGNSPLKCIRWRKDNNNKWVKDDNINKVECGIGIYHDNTTTRPAAVSLNLENGTFKNILLNKSCTTYTWNSTTQSINENVTKLMPCGMSEDGSEIVQVVDNVHSQNGYYKNIYSNKGSLNELKTKSLTSDVITTKQSYVNNYLKVIGLTEVFGNLNVFNGQLYAPTTRTEQLYVTHAASIPKITSNLTLKGTLNVEKDATLKNVNVNSLVSNNSITSKGRLYANEFIELKGVANIGSYCSPNGLLGRKSDGTLLSCSNHRWVASSSAPSNYRTFSRTCVNFGKGKTKLMKASEYTCVLSNVRGNFRGWMEEADVSIHGDGYWYLYMNCGGTDVYSKAICWRH